MSGCSSMLGTTTWSVSSAISFTHAELFAEPHHLDVEVVIGKGELIREDDEGVAILEQNAQNVGQLDDHLARQLGLGAERAR